MKATIKNLHDEKYLYVEHELKDVEDAFETRMLMCLSHRLLLERSRLDDAFFVTGLIPLSEVLKNRSVGIEDIRRILVTVNTCISYMSEQLLDDSNIALEPDLIFTDEEMGFFKFCPVPGSDASFAIRIRPLLFMLFSKLDESGDSLKTGMKLMKTSMREDFMMHDLLRVFSSAEAIPYEQPFGHDRTMENKEEVVEEPKGNAHTNEIDALFLEDDDADDGLYKPVEKKSFLQGIMDRLSGGKEGKAKDDKKKGKRLGTEGKSAQRQETDEISAIGGKRVTFGAVLLKILISIVIMIIGLIVVLYVKGQQALFRSLPLFGIILSVIIFYNTVSFILEKRKSVKILDQS
ncbi:MAG: DUF6382 domain-containing protein [Eubacteriales bacterium]|nr:DUF6382 domain-containing protein [Eubacteriales bacterium]